MHRSITALALAALLTACGASLSSAKSDFFGGRVAQAKDKLVALEGPSRAWEGRQRAEYVLYRGLVHHSLGDQEAAAVWLREAKAIEDGAPGTLSEDDRARLDLALEAARVAAP